MNSKFICLRFLCIAKPLLSAEKRPLSNRSTSVHHQSWIFIPEKVFWAWGKVSTMFGRSTWSISPLQEEAQNTQVFSTEQSPTFYEASIVLSKKLWFWRELCFLSSNRSFCSYDAKQAGTTCGASSQADLTQNLVLKTRMFRFSQYSRQKCRKLTFMRQKRAVFSIKHQYSLTSQNLRGCLPWGLRIED